MPTMTSPPDSIGHGSYRIKGKYVILNFEGEPAKFPEIRTLASTSQNGKYNLDFEVIDGIMDDGSGMPFATVASYKTNTNGLINGTQTDFDGKASLVLEKDEFPCRIEIQFIGYRTRAIHMQKANNYHIKLVMNEEPSIIIGERQYKISKKDGRLVIKDMIK